MCGIFGVLEHAARTTPCATKLEQTARLLKHRGPDGQGVFRDRGIGLIHTRLSLVDLDPRSNQPFWDRSGRYCLVYNGELYDFAHLKSRLESHGIVFRTRSDTEVFLEALVHFGVDETLSQIEGMFAFGLYDAQERILVVARDRMGIKPCFVVQTQERFAFASSVRALQPWFTLRPNAMTISSFLQGSGGPTSGRSFFDNVEMLSPGSILEIQLGSCHVERRTYFRLADLADAQMASSQANLTAKEQIDRVDAALFHSVQSQLQADAPIGGFCSGGVDSSLVMAMAARVQQGLTIFHADVVGPLSECRAAKQLARYLKLDFKRVSIINDDFIDLMPMVTEHYGFPFTMHPNAVPLLKVSQLANQSGIKAVLCGEGADECFLGYPWLIPNFRASIRKLPKSAYQTLSRWMFELERKIRGKGKLPNVSIEDHQLVSRMLGQFERELGPPIDDNQDQLFVPGSNVRKIAERGILSYILRSLLHRNDSMGMAVGVETRFPFLNHQLMRLAVNLPDRAKIRFSPTALDWSHLFMRDKWILRQVATRYLPRELSHRKKIPFPTNAYKRLEVSSSFFVNSFVSDVFGLSRTRTAHLLHHASHSLKLRLLHLEVWGRLYFRGSTTDELSQSLRNHVSFPGEQTRQLAIAVQRKAA